MTQQEVDRLTVLVSICSLPIRHELTILTGRKGQAMEWHRGVDGGGRRERGIEGVFDEQGHLHKGYIWGLGFNVVIKCVTVRLST